MKDDGKKLEGIAGWLALLALYVITAPLRLISGLAEYPEQLTSLQGVWQNSPVLTALVLGEIFGNSVLAAWGCLNVYLFFTKEGAFPKAMIGLMCANITFAAADLVAVEALLDLPITLEERSRWFGQLLSSGIWCLYLVRSERVKNTFLSKSDGRKILILRIASMTLIGILCSSGAFLFLNANRAVTEQTLQAEAHAMTESMGGEMIDDVTRFDNAEAFGLTFIYRYTVKNRIASDIDVNDFVAALYPSLAENNCEGLHHWLTEDVDIQHQYSGSDGLSVATIRITQSDCPDLTDEEVDITAQLSAREIAANAKSAFVSIAGYDNEKNISNGSGFFVRHDGVLVTNLHVLQGVEGLKVTLPNGEIYDTVYVLNIDERRDLAILQIEASGLSVLPIGDDRAMEVGDTVYVLGNPLGFDQTFSDGILSAKRLEDGVQYLQISAPISLGSSGGPVLNEQGDVIGVATARHAEGQNLNIAMPSHYVGGMLAVTTSPVSFETVAGSGPFADTGAVAMRNAEFSELLAIMPASTQADMSEIEPYIQQVVIRMLAFKYGVDEEWIALEGDTTSGFDLLGSGDSAESSLNLEKGEYMAVAACDNDCTDLDIGIVFDGKKPIVDKELDPSPLISFELISSTSVKLVIAMETCATEQCFFGWQIFRKEIMEK
tara:strand:- start:625 stop:2610 length:1986 start_codon:yes stop_codon:yes gene_type:complete